MPLGFANAMRRAAALDSASAPRVVHQSWPNATAVPRVLAGMAARWRAVLPHWRYILWDDAANRRLWLDHRPDLVDVYDGYEHGVERADATRLLYMHALGGVYADLDVAPCNALGAALERSRAAVLVRDPARGTAANRAQQRISNFFFKAPAGHKFFRFVLDGLRSAASNPGGPMHTTGPYFVDSRYKAWLREDGADASTALDVLTHDEWQRAFGTHHWASTWHAGAPGGLPAEDMALPMAEQPVVRNEELLAWLGVDPSLGCPESSMDSMFRPDAGTRLRREVIKATGPGGRMLQKLQVYPELIASAARLRPAAPHASTANAADRNEPLLLVGVLSLRKAFALERRMELRGLCGEVDPALVALRFAMPDADAYDATRHDDVWVLNVTSPRGARHRVVRVLLQEAFFRRALALRARHRFVARMQDDAVFHAPLVVAALEGLLRRAGESGVAILGAVRGWSGWNERLQAPACRNVPPVWRPRICRTDQKRTHGCCRPGLRGPFPHLDGAFTAYSRAALQRLVARLALAPDEQRLAARSDRFREDIFASARLFAALRDERNVTVANVSCVDVPPSRRAAVAPALVYRGVRNNRYQFDRLWEQWASLGGGRRRIEEGAGEQRLVDGWSVYGVASTRAS